MVNECFDRHLDQHWAAVAGQTGTESGNPLVERKPAIQRVGQYAAKRGGDQVSPKHFIRDVILLARVEPFDAGSEHGKQDQNHAKIRIFFEHDQYSFRFWLA